MKLIDYLSGDRRGGEAHDLELEAQRDPLLAEALQGFEENPGDPAEALAELRRRILARAALETRRRHRRLIRRVAAAAVLLIAALTVGLVTLQREERFEAPALAEGTQQPETTNAPQEPSVPDSEQGAETSTNTEQPDRPVTQTGNTPEHPESPATPTDTDTLRREVDPTAVQRPVRYLINGVERASLAGLDTRLITDIAIHDEADGTTRIEISTPQQLPEAALAAAEPSQRLPLPDGNLTEFCEDVEPRLTAPVQPEEEVEEDLPFVSAETLPRFQGQDLSGFRKWVQERISPSKAVLINGIPGRVVVSFVIDTTGRLTQIRILQSPDRALSDEVVRVLEQSPRWEPGRQLDRKVPVKYSIPVDFRPQQQPTQEDRNRN